MAANPPLCLDPVYHLKFPLPYVGEQILLSRNGTEIKLEGPSLRTKNHKWTARGTVFLSNMRMVYVADKPDSSGLEAFELPLAYIVDEDFKQPILFANNLSGRCYMVDGGGPANGGGGEAVNFTIYLKQGGFGTLIPMVWRIIAYVRSSASRLQEQQAAAAQGSVGAGYPEPATSAPAQFLQTALVDPSDPTKVYLTQPLDSSQQRDDAPKFPAPLV